MTPGRAAGAAITEQCSALGIDGEGRLVNPHGSSVWLGLTIPPFRWEDWGSDMSEFVPRCLAVKWQSWDLEVRLQSAAP